MTIRRHWLLAALCVCSIVAGCQIQADEAYDENRFEATVLSAGLTRPMELDVAPDGRVIFIELDGAVKIFSPSTAMVSTAAQLDVFSGQENGLIGLALAPDFEASGWVYLVYSPREGFVGQYVSRFTLQGDQLDLSSEKVILKIPEHRDDCCHHAGSIEFGPGGHLFITTGDNTHPGGDSGGYAPLDERDGRHVYDAQDTSGNTMDLRGKILRIHPTPDGHYTIPPGNLFPPGGPIRGLPEIYVMGCRNPWRMNVDAQSGYLYWGEVGPDAGGDGVKGPRGYDEINQARQAGFFGWPFFIGNNFAYRDYDYATGQAGDLYDVDHPLNHSTTNTGSIELPHPTPAWIYYPYGTSDEFPMMGSGGRTACAGPVYHFDPDLQSDTKLPSHLDNCLIIYDWQRTFIKLVRLDSNSNILSIDPFLTHIPIRRPIDMTVGPEGALYVLDYGETWGINEDSRLIRIDYFHGNRPPVAGIEASQTVGKAPMFVELSAAASRDKDRDDILTYQWEIEGEWVSTGQADSIRHTFEQSGDYDVRVEVTDQGGLSSQKSIHLTVGNDPPVVKIVSPDHGAFVDWGDNLIFKVAVEDYEDGTSEDNPELMSRRVLWDRLIQPAAPESVEAMAQSGSGNSRAGLTMIQHSDCLNCHNVDQRIIGPSFKEIAARYAGDAQALDRAAARIIQGSSQVWGEVPMLPHSQFSLDEAREMVRWVLSLSEPQLANDTFQGLGGQWDIQPATKAGISAGASLLLRASYTDLGAEGIGSLTRSEQISLRTRRVEAEHFSVRHGTQTLSSGTASGGQFIGSISSGHYLVFRDVNLKDITSISARVASPSTGGRLEFRDNAPDGALIAVLEFPPTGEWEKWIETTINIPSVPKLIDLKCLFINTGGGDAFMNLDHLHFGGR